MKTAHEAIAAMKAELERQVLYAEEHCDVEVERGYKRLSEALHSFLDTLEAEEQPKRTINFMAGLKGNLPLGTRTMWHEAEEKDSFCKENCKGFQETGKCFADGECEAKREADKRSDKVLTNDEVKTIIDIYEKHCCECGFGLWGRMKQKDAIAKEVCKRFNNLGLNNKK